MKLTEKYRWPLDLLIQLIRTNFKLRYNDSVLGFIWVILKPLLSFLVLYLVFSNFKSNVFGDADNYQIYLLIGVVFYGYFSESILSGMNSLLGMAHIILKVKFPKELAVLSSQGLALINFMISLSILVVLGLFSDIHPNLLSVLYFLLIIIVLTVMTYSVSLFTSVLTVKLKDLQNIVEVMLQLGFYLTPIIYPLAMLPEKYRAIFMLNPITIIIQAARGALIYGDILYYKELGVILIIAVLLIIIGRFYFNKFVQRVTEYY